MTDDGESQQTNANPGQAARFREDRGVPRGRVRCSGCGAEGVNVRTCPGDGSPHEATTEYRERLNGVRSQARQGYDPTLNEAPPEPETNPATADARTAEVRRLVERTRSDDDEPHPPVFPLDEPEEDLGLVELDLRPTEGAVCHEVTVAVVTRYPAMVMGRLEHLIEEQVEEALWVSTRAYELRRVDG